MIEDSKRMHVRASRASASAGGRASHRLAIVSLLLGCGWGCTSAPPEEPLGLPFHVGMIPIAVTLTGEAIPAGADPQPGDELDEAVGPFAITLPAPELQEAIRAALEEQCFTRVTVLPAKEEGVWMEWGDFEPPPEDVAQWDRFTEDAYWVAAAEHARADILLDCRVRYSGLVAHETTGAFSYNLLLFLLGGPFCYWVDDHDYSSPVEVYAVFYDASAAAIASRAAADTWYESEIQRSEVAFDGEDYDFIDRNGANVGMYLLSLVCPSGFLRKETEPVRRKLVEDIIAEVSSELVAEVRQARDTILDARRQVSFTCDLDRRAGGAAFSVRRAGDGSIRISGSFLVRLDRRVEGLDIYEVFAGGVKIASGVFKERFELGDPSGPEWVVRYPLDVTISPDELEESARSALEDADALQLRITESSMSNDWRTYTFPIGVDRELTR